MQLAALVVILTNYNFPLHTVMAYADLTPSERFVFEWQYHMAGGFNTMLAHLFCKADSANFERLMIAFPDEAQGMWNYLHVDGWWPRVEEKGMERSADFERKPHISERPPEWAHGYAKAMARQCFGLWFTRPENANQVLPTTQINETIDAVFSKPPYAEWNN